VYSLFVFFRFGIEGIVYTSNGTDPSPFTFDEATNSLTAGPDTNIKIFSNVKVQITVEGDDQGMRQKMKMALVEPFVPGISPPLDNSSNDSPSKRLKIK
jgi:exosome complex exonuclease DIS3/RRP44